MKKTNRQTTKLLSLVMAILAVLCIISVPVKAQDYNHSFIITGPDTYRITFGEDYRGKESVTTIRNQTTVPMRLYIQRSVARTKVSAPPKLKQFEWIENSVTNTDVYKRQLPSTYTKQTQTDPLDQTPASVSFFRSSSFTFLLL